VTGPDDPVLPAAAIDELADQVAEIREHPPGQLVDLGGEAAQEQRWAELQLGKLRADVDRMLADPELLWLPIWCRYAIDTMRVPPIVLAKVLLCGVGGAGGALEFYNASSGVRLGELYAIDHVEAALARDLSSWQRAHAVQRWAPVQLAGVVWLATQFGVPLEALIALALRRTDTDGVGLSVALQRMGVAREHVAGAIREAKLPAFAPLEYSRDAPKGPR
jgi:hypothetical protein